MKGLHSHRLKKEQNNPREEAFDRQWQKESLGQKNGRDILSMLFSIEGPDYNNHRKWLELGPPTNRDRIVAATVIQWLGSNVGFDFIGLAVRRCGYEIVRKGEP